MPLLAPKTLTIGCGYQPVKPVDVNLSSARKAAAHAPHAARRATKLRSPVY
jgi:hypothetical protein